MALSFKVVILGEPSVGKTSLVQRAKQDNFNDITETTIGASFASVKLVYDQRGEIAKNQHNWLTTTVSLNIWDTAGSERYAPLTPLYYRDAEVAIVVFDLTVQKTFDTAKNWCYKLQNSNGMSSMKPLRFILLYGNKNDLHSVIDDDFVNTFVNIWNQDEAIKLYYRKGSAKTGFNVKRTFEEMGAKLLEFHHSTLMEHSTIDIEQLDLERPRTKRNSFWNLFGCI